jgi:transposase, IS30 family
MNYKHLSKDERIQIATLYNQNHSIANISRYIKRPQCTIMREIMRNGDIADNANTCNKTYIYNYSTANKLARQRRVDLNKQRIKIIKHSSWSVQILDKLKDNLSPEQISGRLREEQKARSEAVTFPSHVTIYRYIYLNHNTSSNNWTKYLKIIGTKGNYRRKYGTKIRELEREKLNKKNISLRPQIVEQRSRLGDFEGDTIVGLERDMHILTHVDRRSGYLIARLLKTATAQETRDQTLISFKTIPKSKLKTITYDNGVQFSKHQDTEQKLNSNKNLNIQIYFANPYHSWERGTNENTNGLLRYYYPKRTSFKSLTQRDLDKTVKQINNRPRKRLNYLTPKEVFVNNWKKIKLAL